MPGHGLIRTTLNAGRVSTDQLALRWKLGPRAPACARLARACRNASLGWWRAAAAKASTLLLAAMTPFAAASPRARRVLVDGRSR